jgi:DNA-directed RNA polymerase subunit RPC12/RpoP
MTIDFTCQKCEGSFELDAEDLIEGTEKLTCPHCNNKASAGLVDDFVTALTEMRTQVANLSKKFAVSLALETEDVEDEIEEADEDEEEADEDEEELEFDEDDEDVDDEDGFEDEDER